MEGLCGDTSAGLRASTKWPLGVRCLEILRAVSRATSPPTAYAGRNQRGSLGSYASEGDADAAAVSSNPNVSSAADDVAGTSSAPYVSSLARNRSTSRNCRCLRLELISRMAELGDASRLKRAYPIELAPLVLTPPPEPPIGKTPRETRATRSGTGPRQSMDMPKTGDGRREWVTC